MCLLVDGYRLMAKTRPSDATLVVGAARVYDDVIPAALFARLQRMMNDVPYVRTDAQQWLKVWTMADGAIYRSNQWLASGPSWSIRENHGNPQQPADVPDGLSEFLACLMGVLSAHPQLPPLKHILMIPYAWPPKSSISWHQDGTSTDSSRVGAFTFYVHQTWNAEWGGEFLMTELDVAHEQLPFDNSAISDSIQGKGFGTWVTPKPNRLIINPSDMYHKVAKTTEAAAPRLTIQGFLYA